MLTKINRLLSNFEKLLLGLLLFLFPTQMALHFWPSSAFVFGIRVDYLSPSIYITDVLVFVLVGLWCYLRNKEFIRALSGRKKVILIFLLFATINIIFSTFPIISLFRWGKYLEFLLLAIYFNSNKNYSLKPLYFSAILTSLIGIFQFALGHTIGGPMYFLGERIFSVSTPGIALVTLKGQDFLRAYSTFSHPNSMAGYLIALSLFLIISNNAKKFGFRYLGFGIIFLGILLTFSVSALVALSVSLLTYLVLKSYKGRLNLGLAVVIFSLLFSLAQVGVIMGNSLDRYVISQRITERLKLANIAGQIINQKSEIGVGLNTFIPNLPKYQVNGSSIWLLQPVHNFFLLVFSETGIMGLILFIIAIYSLLNKSQKKKEYFLLIPLIFIILTGTTDHYWLTLQQNNLLLTLLISHFI